ncbi:MAG: hypothetical protein ABEJ81_04400 [Haloferacaceae archaeon]
MFDDDHPHEPDEFDPAERWGSPEEDLPNVPSAPSPGVDEADVDPELLGLWWRSVALANVALGGVAVGLMVIGFRRMWVPGLAAVALGLLAGFRLHQHYRAFRRRNADADGGAGDGDGDRGRDGDRRGDGGGNGGGAGTGTGDADAGRNA